MKFRLRNWLLLFAAVLLLAAIFHNPVFGAMGAYLVHADPPQKADVALVLGGDSWGHRILTAGQMVRDGYVPKVMVSGPDGLYDNHECDLAIPYAVRHGYPEAYFIHAEHSARSTVAEARTLIPVLRKAGYKKIAIVTSNYHTRRAGNIFRALAPDLTFVMIAAPDEHFTPDGWWRDRESQKTFLNETEKTFATWLGI